MAAPSQARAEKVQPWNNPALAPNGHPVRENFTAWFGASQVRDASGAPMVVFHGTDVDFDSFDVARSRPGAAFGPGIYLTEVATNTGWKRGAGAQVMPLYARVCRPLDIRSALTAGEAAALRSIGIDHAREAGAAPLLSMERRFGSVSAAAAAAGFDGLLHFGPAGVRHILVFGADAVKSALGNSGLYAAGPSLCDRCEAPEGDVEAAHDAEEDMEPERQRMRG